MYQLLCTFYQWNSTTFLLLMIIFITCCFWYKKTPNSLPGTKGLPLLGIIHKLRLHPEKIFQNLSKKYGPLYMVKIAWFDFVVISDPEIAYEAFAKNDYLNDRNVSFPIFSGKKGLVAINRNDFHKEQRRFGLLTLRSFGMGRRSLEPSIIEIIHESCTKIDDLYIDENKSKSFSMQFILYDMVRQIISSMIFGYDVIQDIDKKEIRFFFESIASHSGNNIFLAVIGIVPALRNIPPFSKSWQEGIIKQRALHSAIKKVIEEHKTNLDQNNPRDFIDCFLIQINSFKDKNIDSSFCKNDDANDDTTDFSSDWKPLSSFTEEQLIAVIRDLFLAGFDTTTNSLTWIILYLCKYKNEQRKMRKEIITNLGENKNVSMSMLEKFPFVRAVIQEVTRLRPIIPLALPHFASKNTNLRGYNIPRGATLLTNIWAIHHDEKWWPEPDRFIPERHINSEGKFIKSQNWIQFNVGARSCLGQQLANMELFMVVVTLFQRFHFTLPSDEDPDMDGLSVFALRPPKFNVIANKHK